MIALRRLAFLLLPAILFLCIAAPRGETQVNNEDVRFAFADTTLLRDTLGLTFERLFPLADSLQMDAASLKSLSVAYRWSLERLVKMADSLEVPIDSVGPIMQREQFNPLANVVTQSQFTYTSTYTPSASGDTWKNDLDNRVTHGKIFLTNRVSVTEEKKGAGGSLGNRVDRLATSTGDWRFSRRFALGASVALTGYDNTTPSGINAESERTGDYGFTMHALPPTWHGISPKLDVLTSVTNLDNVSQKKFGPKSQVTAGVRYNTGKWLSQDVNLTLTNSLLRGSATKPYNLEEYDFPFARARDNDTKARANFNLFRGGPVELTANYQASNSRTQLATALLDSSRIFVAGPSGPETTLVLTPVTNKQLSRIARNDLTSTLRFHANDNSTLDVGWDDFSSSNLVTTQVTSSNSVDRNSFTSSARTRLGTWNFESNFHVTKGINRYPYRDFPRGGYRENAESRALDGKINVQLTRRMILGLEASISLGRSRYGRIDSARTIPVDHDVADQYYKIVVSHDLTTQIHNTVWLKVQRTQNVNIAAASTASNTNTRAYTAEWDWTCAVLTGLTARQNNTISAQYTDFPFASSSNRLSLSYVTTTTLNAVFNSRLSFDLNHTARSQPSGNYRPVIPSDPTSYLSKSDNTDQLNLKATVRYRPINAISVSVDPEYATSGRDASLNGMLAPQRETRTLTLSWGASVNLPVGARGKLSGTVNRKNTASRTTNFDANGATVLPRTETGYVSGYLTFTWTL